jgi:signal transduction histidine kinase
VHVRARPPGEKRVVVVVEDSGVGVEPRHRERVLDVFERLDPRGEGSGVGLALVKRIVESYGGRVWLESAGTGHGTAACVELPLAPENAEPATPAAVRPSGSATPAAGRRET